MDIHTILPHLSVLVWLFFAIASILWVAGAALMVRGATMRPNGVFDERPMLCGGTGLIVFLIGLVIFLLSLLLF